LTKWRREPPAKLRDRELGDVAAAAARHGDGAAVAQIRDPGEVERDHAGRFGHRGPRYRKIVLYLFQKDGNEGSTSEDTRIRPERPRILSGSRSGKGGK
jgi:hypothetical protein